MYSGKQKKLLHPAKQGSVSVKPQLVREKQSISTFQSLQRKSKPCSSSVLYCGCTRAKFPPFDKQNRFFGASIWLWPHLTATAPKALKLFRSTAIHLLSSASGRLHPGSPTKTSEVWSAFVHELKVTMKPLRSSEISHWGIFSPDKADTNSLLKVITWNFRFLKLPPNKCILAHGLTFNKGFFSERPPSEKILQSCRKLENCLNRISREWA